MPPFLIIGIRCIFEFAGTFLMSTSLPTVLLCVYLLWFIFHRLCYHRCFIPECEGINSHNFQPEWLNYTVPYNNSRPDSCFRYRFDPTNVDNATCSAKNFHQSNVIQCDRFITKNNEQTITSRVRNGQNQLYLRACACEQPPIYLSFLLVKYVLYRTR